MNRQSRAMIFALLALTGCGWHPIYAGIDRSGTPVSAELNQVAIDNIPDRQGQLLRNDLIDRMYGKGRPAQPNYRLTINLHYTEEDLAIQANATSTLTELSMNGDFVLKDKQGTELLKGTSHSVADYNKLNDQYATLVSREDSLQRTVLEYSEQIVNRISLYFAQRGVVPNQ